VESTNEITRTTGCCNVCESNPSMAPKLPPSCAKEDVIQMAEKNGRVGGSASSFLSPTLANAFTLRSLPSASL
jgi:hypothetical protein